MSTNQKLFKKINNYLICAVFLCVLFAFYSVSNAESSSGLFCNADEVLSHSELKSKWKALNGKEKKLWNEWARQNPVTLEFGKMHRVDGQKAFGIVLNSRLLAGEVLNTSTPPRKPEWFPGALSLDDAGPFTENSGYMGFRTVLALPIPTKWFVCATPMGNGDEKIKKIEKQFKFIKSLSLEEMEVDSMTPSFAPLYRSIFGSFNVSDEFGGDGEWWDPPKYIWFQLHQYYDGQLAPGILMRGRIQVEL